MSNAYLIGLCRDYIDLVDAQNDPSLTPTECYQLDQQRQVTHNALIDTVGIQLDMYRYAKNVLYDARAKGLI